ncbi:kinase-like domain-containing protein [Colletotrichum phormii]|uniref:Kinase-like domain-containing protein n=1 Tax=Colletotrichum phormii TaxID=359342 RepID=A0AAJ0ELX2_9PEZI|nr:kinase-like domain-containing protein [Colletotrichum phormii]KAK1641335.1 kinase-like domain-containing protein [Colletotrichum phormii]
MAVPQPASIPIPQDEQQNSSSLSSSPRQFPTDLTSPILEEADESESESPNEPVTPISSGRQSQEFTTRPSQDHHDINLTATHQVQTTPKPLLVDTAPTPSVSPAKSDLTPKATATNPSTAAESSADQEPPPTPLSRRPTRGSTSSFKRTMSSIFRRSNSSQNRPDLGFTLDQSNDVSSESALIDTAPSNRRRFSMNKSHTTTRSNSPPSPGSPVDTISSYKQSSHMPTQDDFKKKNRASTGLNLRGRAVNFVGANVPGREKHAEKVKPVLGRRRASSFEGRVKSRHLAAAPNPHSDNPVLPLEGSSPWAQMPDAGVGVKARRMSLSLPDDFQVDVADLLAEFEYLSKFGRHGKHLGKGATSKVTMMSRKGCPNELYAVKEFRAKRKQETQEEYEKKIKSEYSIAKSLHHPNVVETIRLCTDHGRWNHIMEYCSEGDLFGLIAKKYLQDSARLPDRLCLFKQLVQGINYLHSNGIAHRDIKLENLLITKDSKLKITDFGVSEVFTGHHPGFREAGGQCGKGMCSEIRLCKPGMCGSEPYTAPEVLLKETEYDPRGLDVWSAAIVMIYVTFGGNIWSRAEVHGNPQYAELLKGWQKWEAKHPEPGSRITESDYPFFNAFDGFVSPPALRRVLLSMLNPNPAKRATISEIANHRWVKNIECCQLENYDDPALLIDATKKGSAQLNTKRVFCHNHLPLESHGHSLGKMPGQSGY